MEGKYTWIVAIDNSEDDMTAEFFKIEATKSELKHMFMDLQEEAIADDKENFRYGTGSEMEIFEEVDPITGSVSKFMGTGSVWELYHFLECLSGRLYADKTAVVRGRKGLR